MLNQLWTLWSLKKWRNMRKNLDYWAKEKAICWGGEILGHEILNNHFTSTLFLTTIDFLQETFKKLLLFVVTIVPLIFPTLYSKRGIFTRSPLLWLVALLCSNISVDLYILLWYQINLISVDNALIIYSLRSKVLVKEVSTS